MDNADSKKLLMIAYYFPPLGGSGALRPFKLAKYLPIFGWKPVVLTTKNPDWYYAEDRELLNELNNSSKVIRSFMFRSAWFYRLLNPLRIRKLDGFLRQYMVLPDEQAGWIPFAYFKGLDTVKSCNINAIYSTSAPLSTHLIAYLISRKTKLPWIADFRDEWYENPDFNFPTMLHRRFHFNLERKIVQRADKVIAPAPYFCKLLSKHTSDKDKFKTIYMGYDPDDFPNPNEVKLPNPPKSKFTLSFSGLFYRSFKPTRLLKVIEGLIEENLIPLDKIKLLFIGANDKSDIGYEDRFKLCEFTGFVSHRTAINFMIKSDALLLLLSHERGKDVIPSKTFEYIGSSKPILALIPSDGEVAKILTKIKRGFIADFENADSIKENFLKIFKDWESNKGNNNPDLDKLPQFNQKLITKQFSNILNQEILN